MRGTRPRSLGWPMTAPPLNLSVREKLMGSKALKRRASALPGNPKVCATIIRRMKADTAA